MCKYLGVILLTLCFHVTYSQKDSFPSQEINSFFKALKENDIQAVKMFPHSFTNEIDSSGYYPISIAVRKKSVELLEVLLNMGANPNTINQDHSKTTALMQCSNFNALELAKLLMENGADVNIIDKNGDPVIHWTAYLGQVELTKLLLNHNARTDLISIHSDGVLNVALKEWKSDIVGLLVENGVTHYDLSPEDEKLIELVKHNNTIVVKKLLTSENANTQDASGTPLLVTAAELGLLDMVKVLLSKGANIDGMNPTGHTALNRAVYFKNFEVVDYLLNQGADVNKTDKRYILTPLIAAAIKNNVTAGKELIASGADINITDKINNFSPLIWAVVYGNRDFVEMLMPYKPDLDILTSYGSTVMQMTKDPEMLALLQLKTK
ncbi:ankyrin repeat domain-containing protein [uncultured Allomuricauda sp.]|uniref:ankyrin repeat domain-containing protein n=1 Tax=Flagellimonas sp. W118 TaxID=3410791 RepID=UPI002624A45B|nr:ankyrin repeat domain-containing protein [uncultured Allomuricauda sp.]